MAFHISQAGSEGGAGRTVKYPSLPLEVAGVLSQTPVAIAMDTRGLAALQQEGTQQEPIQPALGMEALSDFITWEES